MWHTINETNIFMGAKEIVRFAARSFSLATNLRIPFIVRIPATINQGEYTPIGSVQFVNVSLLQEGHIITLAAGNAEQNLDYQGTFKIRLLSLEKNWRRFLALLLLGACEKKQEKQKPYLATAWRICESI